MLVKGTIVGYMYQSFKDGKPGPSVTIHFNKWDIQPRTKDALLSLAAAACRQASGLLEDGTNCAAATAGRRHGR